MAIVTAQAQIRGRKAPAVLHEEAMRKLASDRSITYECHTFLLPTPTTDESIKTVVDHATDCSCGRADGPFAVITRAERVAVLNDGGGNVGVKYNATDSDVITIADGIRHDWDFTEVEDIFLTNDTGAAIPLTFLMA